MRRRIDLAEARSLLLSRTQLLASGMTERQLRADVQAGLLIRLHRGFYAPAAVLRDLWPEGRHLLRVLAVHAASPAPGPVFSHTSAAVVHGHPLYVTTEPPVQVVINGRRHSRIEAGVIRRDMAVAEADIVDVDGIRVTSLPRTVADIARTMPREAAVAHADSALRSFAVVGNVQDAEAAEHWRRTTLERVAVGTRGARQARWVLHFADGRAQLPGESVSRLHLHTLGYTRLDLQIRVVGSAGDEYWLDFGFLGVKSFGEFDGLGKYTDADMRAGLSMEDVLIREKLREDDVRGVTGWGFARWGHEHIRTADTLGRRLAAFRILPPG
ncbi:type IV toxin-antitoxin system AbiEi family antitoxin domain-containing protein [Microbacterium sp.]|uniref:type IV toxin-antitoxin system AbiEi family antitoxin domain-containing protein n=1 Tax=Microbacterium sp. TaxID=51671 RepID=UPI0028112DF9|nr:type IV toxin-antitoxin system AbiEi family antitoxin domain-containing protein [Microbacterium sp.]